MASDLNGPSPVNDFQLMGRYEHRLEREVLASRAPTSSRPSKDHRWTLHFSNEEQRDVPLPKLHN